MKRREWTNTMIAKLEDIETKDPKEYWKIVNEIREKKASGTNYNTTTFVDFFKDLFSQNETENDIEKFVNESLENINDTDLPDFTMKELKSAIKWLKTNKAVGPDGMPAEIFKECPTEILEILLFSASAELRTQKIVVVGWVVVSFSGVWL